MVCFPKIPRRHLIYSFLFLVFLFCFSLLGLSSDSYAVSNTCTLTIPINATSVFTNFCTTDPVYIRLDSVSFTLDSGSGFSNSFNFGVSYSSSSAFNNYFTRYDVPFTSFPFSYSDNSLTSNILPNFYPYNDSSSRLGISNNFIYFRIFLVSSVSGSVDLTFTYADSLDEFFGGDPTPCPDPVPCPPIPENPYDQKLEDIKRAIIIVGAVPLVIYFFVCVYKIIVKDGGSRR